MVTKYCTSAIVAVCIFMPLMADAAPAEESLITQVGSMKSAPTSQWNWSDKDWGTALVLRFYRSYGSLFVDLDEESDFIFWEEDEIKLYRDLGRRSFKPGYFLIEITGYPLATFSAWMESNLNSQYDFFDIGEKFNLIRSLGAGYQEPWSTSIFIGQLATFWDIDDQGDLRMAANGAAGTVVTGGFQQLFDNSIVNGSWFRVEWKIKGEGVEGARRRFWDIKAGFRYYGLPEIPNTVGLSLKRQRTDNENVGTGVLENSMMAVDLQLPVSGINSGLTRALVEYARFVPFRSVLVGLKIGFLYENRMHYDGEMQSFGSQREKSWELIIQPMVVL